MNRIILCCCFPWLLLVGCAKTHEGKPLAPTVITVNYKGRPVEGAVVALSIPNNPPPAYGTTDAKGRAQLGTFSDRDGALIGQHTVTILKQKFGKAKDADPGKEQDVAYFPATGASPLPVVEDLLPAKYKLSSTSGLTAEIKSGRNEISFELDDL